MRIETHELQWWVGAYPLHCTALHHIQSTPHPLLHKMYPMNNLSYHVLSYLIIIHLQTALWSSTMSHTRKYWPFIQDLNPLTHTHAHSLDCPPSIHSSICNLQFILMKVDYAHVTSYFLFVPFMLCTLYIKGVQSILTESNWYNPLSKFLRRVITLNWVW